LKSWPSLAPYGTYLAIPGGELFYYDTKTDDATGKPALVLIHGLGDEADTWRYVFPPLAAAGYRVIALDLPGFGRSIWKGKISMRGHCAAVLRLLTTAGIASPDNPAVLAGSSLGAAVSELAACKRPDLVKALVLIDGCFPLDDKIDKGLLKLMLPSVGKKWYRSFRNSHKAAWESLYPYYGDLDAMSAEDREFLRERVIARVESENQERGYLSTLRSMNIFFMFNGSSLARKIKTYPGKIAILWGEKDRILPHEKAASFRGLRPDAQMTLISGAGHLPHQEKHEETAAQMLRVLKEILWTRQNHCETGNSARKP
jgi:pimeloyl-ACP methyl ester carboxylesterase